jgi:hypothetical protein
MIDGAGEFDAQRSGRAMTEGYARSRQKSRPDPTPPDPTPHAPRPSRPSRPSAPSRPLTKYRV